MAGEARSSGDWFEEALAMEEELAGQIIERDGGTTTQLGIDYDWRLLRRSW